MSALVVQPNAVDLAEDALGQAQAIDGPIIDLFAGPGGWDVAAWLLGLHPLGIEWETTACLTRRAAGLATLQADVGELDPADVLARFNDLRLQSWQEGLAEGWYTADEHPAPVPFADVSQLWGLIASPPCQAFSMAGKGEGRRALAAYIAAIAQVASGKPIDRAKLDEASNDERGHLVLEPLRWAVALRPRWIALEQVEPVLPLWEVMAAALRNKGYSTWTGVLTAERYGVPQTRRRAILLASLDGPVGEPPATHQRYIAPSTNRLERKARGTLDLFAEAEDEVEVDRARIVAPEDRDLQPWVSMAEALGWAEGPRPSPAPTITSGGTAAGGVEVFASKGSRARVAAAVRFRANHQPNASERSADEPAPTIKGGHDYNDRVWIVGSDIPDGSEATHLRAGTNDHDTARPVDAPANTLRFGERLNDVSWIVDTGNTRSGTRAEGRARPTDEPAPAVTTRADQFEWRDDEPDTTPFRGQTGMGDAPVRGIDEPAHTMSSQGLAKGRDIWIGDPEDPEAGEEGPRIVGQARSSGPGAKREPRSLDEPSYTLRANAGGGSDGVGRSAGIEWVTDRPATTVAGDPRIFPPGHKINADDERAGRGGQQRSGAGWTDARPSTAVTGTQRSEEGGTVRPPNAERADGGQGARAIRVTAQEAAVLQSFPADYPWQGPKSKVFQQIGNAVPPLLALPCLRVVIRVALSATTPEAA